MELSCRSLPFHVLPILFDIPHFCSPLFFGGLVHTLGLSFSVHMGLPLRLEMVGRDEQVAKRLPACWGRGNNNSCIYDAVMFQRSLARRTAVANRSFRDSTFGSPLRLDCLVPWILCFRGSCSSVVLMASSLPRSSQCRDSGGGGGGVCRFG